MTLTSFSLLVATIAAPAVDNVVVYADRAQVTRTTNVTCRTAPISFGELPAGLDARTLRARVSGKAEVIGVSSSLVRYDESAEGRIRDLEKQVEAAAARVRALDDALQSQQERLQQAEQYRALFLQAAGEQINQARLDLGRWQSALSVLRNERADASKKIVELRAEQRAAARALDLLQRRLNHLRPARAGDRMRSASVTLACNGSGQVKLSLSYVVPGATWRPEYDLRYTPSGKGRVGPGTVELTVAAVIQQATGEDWSNAQLVLSTAKPRLGAETPKPAPLFVNGHEEQKGKVLVQSTEERKQLRGPATPTSGEAADIEDRGQSFVLTLPRRVTVAADGRPYWFPVAASSTQGEARLVAVPKLQPFVYQVVQLNNPARHPLVGGRVHVYRRGSYIGDTHLDYLAPGEPMEVSLGIDEELRVERDELHNQNRGSGTLSSKQHMERAYRMRITNRSKERAQVELRENIPVTKVEEVKVELLKKKTTAGFAHDKYRGFLTWQLDIGSGKRVTTNVAYAIHLPDSWQVH